MKIPQTPPNHFDLMAALPKGRLSQIIMAANEPTNEYWHWDDLRHRQPPSGLNHKEWWMLIKFGRGSQFRPIPLVDKKHQPFAYFTTDSMLATLHDVDMRAGGSVQMSEQVTNPETRNQYYVSSLMEEAITSSQLEGAATTREIAREMLRSSRPPRDVSERMILNNYRTMRQLAEWKSEPLTPDLVFAIHKLITEDTLKDPTAAGRFRRDDEPIFVLDDAEEILHAPPPANTLRERMKTMCEFANAPDDGPPFLHPVVRAAMLHFWLAYDHPFKDGNGRTARALFYWLMLRRGFWLFEFVSISQALVKAPAQYARSFLHTETDDNDLNYFILHQLNVIKKGVDSLHDYIERKSAELKRISSALRHVKDINHRQEAIINRAVRHPGTVFTIKSHRASHAVAYDTARTDLFGLVDLGFLAKRKRGKGFYFEATSDLATMLSAGSKSAR